MAGWGSLGEVFSSGFRGTPGFPETRLDGLAKLPTIPPVTYRRTLGVAKTIEWLF